MFQVIDCLTLNHDRRLTLLAVLVCFFASFGTMSLLQRAYATTERARCVWIATAGTVSGFGIWATHFIAMLAYDPGLAIAYDIWLTILSLAAAVTVTMVGIAYSVLVVSRWSGVVGGTVMGAGMATMHYLGMAALDMPGWVTWSPSFIVASIATGIVFSILALSALKTPHLQSSLLGTSFLTIAILSLHFTGMSAATVMPDPARGSAGSSLSSTMLAIVIACTAVAVLGISLISALYDVRLSALRARQRFMEEAEARVRCEHKRLDAAVNNMTQGLCMFDANARLVICNQQYREMYGLSDETARPGVSLERLLEARAAKATFSGDVRQYASQLAHALYANASTSNFVESADGRTVAVVSRSMEGGGWVATHEDITEQRRAAQRIAFLAHHDVLTGRPNRAYFVEYLETSIARARALGKELALFCIDLDRFKEVNDVFGHSVGDALLRYAADRLHEVVSPAFVARLGGDEFTIVVTDCSAERAAELAIKLRTAFDVETFVGGQLLRIGLSIGIAIYPGDGTDSDALLTNADAALYHCKSVGRNGFQFFSVELDHKLRDRRLVQRELRKALENNQLVIHYQPQARMSGEIVGFEALVRWRHPSRGLLAPALFVPAAEESGLIIQMGEWVLREACKEAASWQFPGRLSVNLSPVQFQHGDLPGMVHSALLETGLSPSRLELEITEGVLISDFSRAIAILRRLRLLGVRLSLDDFGTGYSSLSYLQSFNFDRVKLDRTFISQVEHSAQAAAIVAAVINLAHSLELPVIVEGVETIGQMAFLRDASCDEVQGFLIGHPSSINHYIDITEGASRHSARLAV